MIHPLSDVQSKSIGKNTKVWQFVVILEGAKIGKSCNICAHVFIENEVLIKDFVTIKSGVQIWDGITLEDHVFVGPNVTFTNDLRPRSKAYPDNFPKTIVKMGASLGANATILPGLTIGAYSMIGAGSTVVKDVPGRALVVGNPAKRIAWLNEDGTKMFREGDYWKDHRSQLWKERSDELSIVKEKYL